MCNGFGAIVSNELNVYFCEPNGGGDVSHSEILRRLGWRDNTDQQLRRFVRVECADWTMDIFAYDERDSLPGWVEEHDDEIRARVGALLDKVAPAWDEYKQVNAQALAEYEKVRFPALAEYENVCNAALDEYQKVRFPALAEYENVCNAAWATMVMTMSKAAGYVAAKEQGQ